MRLPVMGCAANVANNGRCNVTVGHEKKTEVVHDYILHNRSGPGLSFRLPGLVRSSARHCFTGDKVSKRHAERRLSEAKAEVEAHRGMQSRDNRELLYKSFPNEHVAP
jgi:hypothetical protein